MGLIAGVGEQISEPDNLAVYLQSAVQHDRIGCGRRRLCTCDRRRRYN